MGLWYNNLTRNRHDATPEISQKAAALTSGAATPTAKMRALAQFLQRDVRYVALELGIGGYQPHPAVDVFAHKYGDCKDKATLLSAMLKSIGIDSYYAIINSGRGSVTPETPAHMGGFDHVILAIKLPNAAADPFLIAVMSHPKLGRLLFFDPTDELTPFGHLSGSLQANYGLLVTPDGGELTELPQLPPLMNGVQRTAKLTLTPTGTLTGDVNEKRVGDAASRQRYALKTVSNDTDRIKPIETILARSLASYHLTKASIRNLDQTDQPFEFNYSLVAENYAKNAGGLLLVRPRVVGNKSSDLLETKEPRQYPVVFEGPSRDTDTFEITVPAGYEVDDLPPAVSAEYTFASYYSKAEVAGNVLRYTRTFEVKDPSVPLSKVNDLKTLYRIIAGDERNTAVLRPTNP
jgi:Transglutaminase-like superfamily